MAQAPPTVQFFKEAKPGGSTHATRLRSLDIKLAQLTPAASYITIIVPKYKGHSSFPFPLGIKEDVVHVDDLSSSSCRSQVLIDVLTLKKERKGQHLVRESNKLVGWCGKVCKENESVNVARDLHMAYLI